MVSLRYLLVESLRIFLPNYSNLKVYIEHINGFIVEKESFLKLFIFEEQKCSFGDFEKGFLEKIWIE